jgi:murein DD-endopeptidase MepM/ murein hydrolase activator NlpD
MPNFEPRSDVNFVILKDEKKLEKSSTKWKGSFFRYVINIGTWLIYLIKAIAVFILYFLTRIVNYTQIQFYRLSSFVQETGDAMVDSEARSLYFFEIRVSFKIFINKIRSNVSVIWFFTKKLYLLIMVISVIFGLRFVGGYLRPNLTYKSFLNQAFDNYSYLNNNQNYKPVSAKAIATVNKEIIDIFPLNKITVKAEDKIENIAENQNLLVDTILVNNNIEQGKPLPAELIVPWQDGYVYFPKTDTTPKEISDKYKIDEKIIYEANEDKLNEKRIFVKDSTIIIPTKTPQAIKKIIDKDKELLKLEEQIKQQNEKQSKLAKSYQDQFNNPSTTGGYKYADAVSADKISGGFIWPTKGSISRCIQPGHPGCDIASPSMPPVYSIADGVVIDVYRFTVYGYGNAVVISHGNGLTSLYAHLNEIYAVKGQAISQGQALGQMGNTGNSTGTHLHIEIKQNGIPQNPLAYFP